jgi:hypothetical protein
LINLLSTEEGDVDISLNFINQSNDAEDSRIVIFQKNVAIGSDLVIAWHVIQDCGRGDNHRFVYPMTMTVGASDGYGNIMRRLDARPGQAFAVTSTKSGDQLGPAGTAGSPAEVQVLNRLAQGAIDAAVYKGGALLATRTSVARGQVAAFEFNPTIWIGAVPRVVQGEMLSPAIVDSVDTELSLMGIASADIVMTGGGAGPNARPLEFILRNVVLA